MANVIYSIYVIIDKADLDILIEGYYDVEKDRYNVALIDDTRRPRFTLEHLNKLR